MAAVKSTVVAVPIAITALGLPNSQKFFDGMYNNAHYQFDPDFGHSSDTHVFDFHSQPLRRVTTSFSLSFPDTHLLDNAGRCNACSLLSFCIRSFDVFHSHLSLFQVSRLLSPFTSQAMASPALVGARPQRARAPTYSRDSNALRASVLDVALQLGVGTSRAVENLIFDSFLEEDEEEEVSLYYAHFSSFPMGPMAHPPQSLLNVGAPSWLSHIRHFVDTVGCSPSDVQ